MSEYLEPEVQLPPDDIVPSEFGFVGVIGLAAAEAMRYHGATVESMRKNPAEAMAAIATQASLLDGFASLYPENDWNQTAESDLRARFTAYVMAPQAMVYQPAAEVFAKQRAINPETYDVAESQLRADLAAVDRYHRTVLLATKDELLG